MNIQYINSLNKHLQNKPIDEILLHFADEFNGKICFASSMGVEDQVLTHIIATNNINIPVFTIDTGRLFQETYDLIDRSKSRYKINIDVFFPSSVSVESMVKTKGVNLFYESIENRKQCCGVRKIESLNRALNGKKAWITGLRKEQSLDRSNAKLVEWDDVNKLIKINPLLNWEERQVWDFVKEHKIPYNPLHDIGFKSIGCQPCTRAINAGESLRAGRWWWEEGNKECGLHAR